METEQHMIRKYLGAPSYQTGCKYTACFHEVDFGQEGTHCIYMYLGAFFTSEALVCERGGHKKSVDGIVASECNVCGAPPEGLVDAKHSTDK